MTFIKGVWGAVDNVGAAWQNDIEDIRSMLFEYFGRAQGVIRGFAMTPNGSSLAVDFTAGAALIEQRGTDITGDAKGYYVYSDTTTTVTFAAPSAATRNDAVVFVWGDPQYGALGASVPAPGGPQIVIVQGVSGSSTPRTDAQIQTAVNVGGWFRYADVLIAPGNTVVAPGNITDNHPIASGNAPKFTKITLSGTWTKSVNPAPKYVRVRVQGGGGAGGGAAAAASGQHTKGGGGGAGGYSEKWFPGSQLAAQVAITMGFGGSGIVGANGNNGTATTFSHTTPMVGGGGLTGVAAASSAASFGASGGAGGSASGGDTNIGGSGGSIGWGDASLSGSGTGGNSPLGGGGSGFAYTAAGNFSAGNNATGNGAGGGGAAASSTGSAVAGGNGSDGCVIVEEFFT